MNPANTAAIAQARVLAVTVPAAAAPIRFLTRAGAGPRGFWATSGRWIAHSGTLATVTSEGARSGELFSAVEASAQGLVASGSGQGANDTPGVRFYGGFAFSPEYATSDLWSGFPPALFHVPEVELEGVPGESSRLTVRMLVDADGGDDESILSRLATRANQLCAELEGEGSENSSSRIDFVRAESKRTDWDAAVRGALSAIGTDRVSKVVLARTLDVITEHPLDPIEVVHHLWKGSPGSHVFYFEPAGGCALVGAAPEIVTAVSGARFHATAVAGTVARGET